MNKTKFSVLGFATLVTLLWVTGAPIAQAAAVGTDGTYLSGLLNGTATSVVIPSNTYTCDGNFIYFGGKTVTATGATFNDCRFLVTASNTSWTGGTSNQVNDTGLSPMFAVYGAISNVTVSGLNMNYASAYTGYEIDGASNVNISGFTIHDSAMSGATINSGDHINFDNFTIVGQDTGGKTVDDFIAIAVIKGGVNTGNTTNINISNCHAVNTADVLKIQGGVTNMPGKIDGVTVTNCTADQVLTPIFFWGFPDNANVTFSNIKVDGLTITDSTGSRYGGMYFLLQNAQSVSNVTLNNIQSTAHHNPSTSWYNNDFWFNLSNGGTIKNLSITNSSFSNYSEAPHFIYYTPSGTSSISGLVVDKTTVDSTSQQALYTTAPITGLTVGNSTFQNTDTSGTGQYVKVVGDVALNCNTFSPSGKTYSVSGTVSNSCGTTTSSGLQLVSINPSSGTGSSMTLTSTISDGAGAGNVSNVITLVNNILYALNSCTITYDANSNTVSLMNDDFTTGSVSALLSPTSGTIHNSQCTVDVGNSSVTQSGNNLIIKYPITFSSGWSGAKNIYLHALNKTGAVADYALMGTWTIPTVVLGDTTAPTNPTGLLANTISSSQINLSWSASSDNVAVTGYNVYRDGLKIANSINTSYQDTGLTPDTTYSYTIAAYDAAGNTSNQSTNVSTKTLSLQTGLYIGEKIKTTANVNVRRNACTSSVLRGIEHTGASGTIVAGPKTVCGYTWWSVSWDNGLSGWSVANFLSANTLATNIVSPIQSSQSSIVTPVTSPTISCITNVTGSWVAQPFATQSGNFTVSFDDTPNATNMDGHSGLSGSSSITSPSKLAVLIHYNPAGYIEAFDGHIASSLDTIKNGGAYTSITKVPYQAGKIYHIRFVVNTAGGTYSTYITPPGGNEIQIASNYGFRVTGIVSSFNNINMSSDTASHTVCNVTITN
jgi:chitodextrinase